MNTSFVKNLSYEELKELLSVVNNELSAKNPDTIEANRRMAEYYAERKRMEAIRVKHTKQVVPALKKVLVAGTRLKMNGCKDGAGIREFIRWHDDTLVCWQISRRTIINRARLAETIERNTNVVTTHMPDKVARVWMGGREWTIKQLLENT
jgi:hypothetical protein